MAPPPAPPAAGATAGTFSEGSYRLAQAALGIGVALEWMDYQLYSQLSRTMAPLFFPPGDATAQAISYWGVFAIGFATRPIGSIAFGHWGDIIGRKASLVATLLVMGVPSVLIGCLPTYAMAGVAAPVLLAVMRAIQGLALGGEFGCALVYGYELAPAGAVGAHSNIIMACNQLGQLAGIACVMIVIAACSAAQLALWGWRLPFLLGAFTVGVGLVARLKMPEPLLLLEQAEEMKVRGAAAGAGDYKSGDGDYKSRGENNKSGDLKAGAADPEAPPAGARRGRRARVPLARLLRLHWLPLVVAIAAFLFNTVSAFTYSAWLPSHLTNRGVDALMAQGMLAVGLFMKFAGVLVIGQLSDRGLPLCTAAAALCAAGGALPFALCAAIRAYAPGGGLGALWAMQVVLQFITGCSMGCATTVVASLFPTDVRTTAYNIVLSFAALPGGFSPMAITAISAPRGPGAKSAATAFGPAIWILCAAAPSAVSYIVLRRLWPSSNRADSDETPLAALLARRWGRRGSRVRDAAGAGESAAPDAKAVCVV